MLAGQMLLINRGKGNRLSDACHWSVAL